MDSSELYTKDKNEKKSPSKLLIIIKFILAAAVIILTVLGIKFIIDTRDKRTKRLNEIKKEREKSIKNAPVYIEPVPYKPTVGPIPNVDWDGDSGTQSKINSKHDITPPIQNSVLRDIRTEKRISAKEDDTGYFVLQSGRKCLQNTVENEHVIEDCDCSTLNASSSWKLTNNKLINSDNKCLSIFQNNIVLLDKDTTEVTTFDTYENTGISDKNNNFIKQFSTLEESTDFCKDNDDCKAVLKTTTCIEPKCCSGTDCVNSRCERSCGVGGCKNNSDCCGGDVCYDKSCVSCKNIDETCKNNSDCCSDTMYPFKNGWSGLSCIKGVCKRSCVWDNCINDSDCCAVGGTCTNGLCSCASNEDCDTDKVCLPTNVCGDCVSKERMCNNDENCCGDMSCQNGKCKCIEKDQACSGDNECCGNMPCENGICKCFEPDTTTNVNCEETDCCTGKCTNGKCSCTYPCTENSECCEGDNCIAGMCGRSCNDKHMPCDTNENCCLFNTEVSFINTDDIKCVKGSCNSCIQPNTSGCEENNDCCMNKNCTNGTCECSDIDEACLSNINCCSDNVCKNNQCKTCTALGSLCEDTTECCVVDNLQPSCEKMVLDVVDIDVGASNINPKTITVDKNLTGYTCSINESPSQLFWRIFETSVDGNSVTVTRYYSNRTLPTGWNDNITVKCTKRNDVKTCIVPGKSKECYYTEWTTPSNTTYDTCDYSLDVPSITWTREKIDSVYGGVCPKPNEPLTYTKSCPVDCELNWGDWPSCDCSTSSTVSRTATVTKESKFGGSCPPLTETRQCLAEGGTCMEGSQCCSGTCSKSSCTNCTECDCKYTATPWTNCPSCSEKDVSKMKRTRTINIQKNATYGGVSCPTNTVRNCSYDTQSCYTTADCCYPAECIDNMCVLSE